MVLAETITQQNVLNRNRQLAGAPTRNFRTSTDDLELQRQEKAKYYDELASYNQQLAEYNAAQNAWKNLPLSERFAYGDPNVSYIDIDRRRNYIEKTGMKVNGQDVYLADGKYWVGKPSVDYVDTNRGRSDKLSGVWVQDNKLYTYQVRYNSDGDRKLTQAVKTKSGWVWLKNNPDPSTFETVSVSGQRIAADNDPSQWSPRTNVKPFENKVQRPEQPNLKPEYYGRYPDIAKENIAAKQRELALKQQQELSKGYYQKPIERYNKQTQKWETVYRPINTLSQAREQREKATAWKRRLEQEQDIYYQKSIERYNKQTQKWETVYRKIPTYKEAIWNRTLKEELKPKETTITPKPISGMISAAPTSQKFMGWIRRKDPKLAEGITYYQSRKLEAPFWKRAGQTVAETFIISSVGGAVVGAGVGVAEVSGTIKAIKSIRFVQKASPYVSKIVPKALKFGSAAAIGYEATVKSNIAKSMTGSTVKEYEAAALVGVKGITFVYGFGKGYKAGKQAVTSYAQPYKLRQFEKQLAEDYAKKPKFQYVRKEPIYSQRTLQGGTISQSNIKANRYSIDKLTLVPKKPIYSDGRIVKYSPSIEINTLRPTTTLYGKTGQTVLSKPNIKVYDLWQNKVSTFKPNKIKFYEADKGRYMFKTIYQRNIPNQFNRPDFSINNIRKQTTLSDFGLSSPLPSKIKSSSLRDMIAAPPTETKPTVKITPTKTSSLKLETPKTTTRNILSKLPTQTRPNYVVMTEKRLTPLQKPERRLYLTLFPKIQTISSSKQKLSETIKFNYKFAPITKALIRQRQVPETKQNLRQIPSQKIETIQKTDIITRTITVPVPTPYVPPPVTPPTEPPPEIPVPEVPPPFIPALPSLSFNPRKQKSGSFKFKQPTKYRASLYSSVFKVYGKESKWITKTGLGARPIPKKTKIDLKLPSLKKTGFKTDIIKPKKKKKAYSTVTAPRIKFSSRLRMKQSKILKV